jgi:hypothetical protein
MKKNIATVLTMLIICAGIFAFLIFSKIPRTDIFLEALNFDKTTNPTKMAIYKYYLRVSNQNSCSIEGAFGSKKVVIKNARLSFAAALMDLASNDFQYAHLDKKVIINEIGDAIKGCGVANQYFRGDIGDRLKIKYPPAVYIIMSKNIDAFKLLMDNCISFDESFETNKRLMTARQLLDGLAKREDKDVFIFMEMSKLLNNRKICSPP